MQLIFSLYPPSCCLDIYGTLYFIIYLCGESLWLSPPPRFIYYYALKIGGFVFIIIILITIILTDWLLLSQLMFKHICAILRAIMMMMRTTSSTASSSGLYSIRFCLIPTKLLNCGRSVLILFLNI